MPSTVKCPGCGASIRPDRLERHLVSVHPREADQLRARLPEEALRATTRTSGHMSRTEQRTYLVLAALIIGGVLIFALLPRGGSGPQEGREAPGFALQAAGGASHSLSSYAGQVVFLDFMSPTCPACIAETDATLVPLHHAYADRVVFLSIDIFGTQSGEEARVLQFKADHGTTWPYLLDEGSVADAYEVTRTPTTVLVGKDGRIANVHVGTTSYDVFAAELDAQLAA